MIGNIGMTLNKETMLEALQEYLDKRITEKFKVTDLVINYQEYSVTLLFSRDEPVSEASLP